MKAVDQREITEEQVKSAIKSMNNSEAIALDGRV